MKTIEINSLDISSLHQAYANNEFTPLELMKHIREKAEQYHDYHIWIHLLSEKEQSVYLENLKNIHIEQAPLWGIPFAIKDNIDLDNIPTTAACEDFSYLPKESAFVVKKLIEAGAIPVGKTNMDQFATGLNGTRSPWGACKNSFNEKYISGGSSSGSAVAVALGLASFSLGTDTAGSGRVPACFNNLIGVKPSRGLISSSGLVPACRSLDCITIFANNTDDANAALAIAEGYDKQDAYSRENPYLNQSRHYGEYKDDLRIGVIPENQLKFFGDDDYQSAYHLSIESLKSNGINIVELDYSLFDEAAQLLYEGPWVAERYIATTPLIQDNPDAMFPVVRDIIQSGANLNAVDLFQSQYRLQLLKKACDEQLSKVDCLLTPTAGRLFTIDEMLEEPIKRNSELGYYTNFMNLLDYAAVAVPTQITPEGLPFGLTLVGPTFSDRKLLSIARNIHSLFELNMGASQHPVEYSSSSTMHNHSMIDVLVCGAHLSEQPLNWQLTERGALLKQQTQTAPIYSMFSLANSQPAKPGLVVDEANGAAISVEVWTMPSTEFGSFVADIPSPLGIGKVKLIDGSWVCGFICEPHGLHGAENITHLGGWVNYLETKRATA